MLAFARSPFTVHHRASHRATVPIPRPSTFDFTRCYSASKPPPGTTKMSTSPSRKRRKVAADASVPAELAVSDAGRPADEHVKEPPTSSASSATLSLPAAVWGGVLDYLYFDEVLQAILVNKFMANTVPNSVEELFIRKPSNLDAVAARRFPNVTYVRIDCLTRWDDKETCVLSATTAKRAVPFLTSFLKLKEFFIGSTDKLDPDEPHRMFGYFPEHCVSPDNHEELMRDMTKYFCSAFESRVLSQKIRVQGLWGDYARTHLCRPARAIEGRPCTLCREICITFPPYFIRNMSRKKDTSGDVVGHMSDICMTSKDFIAALKARPDGEAFLRVESKRMLLNIIKYDLCWSNLDRSKPSLDRKVPKEARMIQRLEEEGVNEPTKIFYYSDDSLSSLKCIVENGFDPKTLTKKMLMRRVNLIGRHAMFDTTLDALCNLGLPIDRNDFFIVDDEEDVR